MSNENRKGIACGGQWIIDRVKVVDHYPEEQSVAMILGETMGGGGGAHNVTLNLARFDPDLRVVAVGMIGNDADGDWIMNECGQYPNIRTDQLRRTPEARTSYADVFSVKSTGKRTFFHDRGANRLFGPATVDVDRLHVALFHIGYLLLLDGMDKPDPQYGRVSARFLHDLRERGIKTSIDLVSIHSPDFADVVSPALQHTDYCIINDFESEKLTGVPVRWEGSVSIENLEQSADRIFEKGVHELVIIHFPEGAFAKTRAGKTRLQPSLELPAGFIVGSTGAGDSFCAGVLYGMNKGWGLDRCLEFAVCAGAQNLRDLTTTGSITRWQEIIRLKEQYPFRKWPD
jgi:sugar/nucleoside kinase (ribokinase family)